MIDFNITFKLNVYFSIKLDFCPVILKSLALLLNPLLFFSVDYSQPPPPPPPQCCEIYYLQTFTFLV